MLGTVGGSVQKITALLARLKAPEEEQERTTLSAEERLRIVLALRDPAERARTRLDCAGSRDFFVRMPQNAFDAVLTHLIDNAFEASGPDSVVRIELRQEGSRVTIDIIDQGAACPPSSSRDRLFQPFSSSKSEGFGLGVYQARELLRRGGGDLLVTSTLGAGTVMRLSMPVAERLNCRPASAGGQ